MAAFNPRQIVDLNSSGPEKITQAYGHVGDAKAHQWDVVVVRGNVPVDLTGYTALAMVIIAAGTVEIVGTISGNVATAIFPAACYTEGVHECFMRISKASDSSEVITAIMHLNVTASEAGPPLDPGTDITATLSGALAQITACQAATVAANDAADYATGIGAGLDARTGAVETAVTSHATRLSDAEAAISDHASQLAEMENIGASYVANSILVNLFNKATITADVYVSHVNGNLVNFAGFWSSDFIPVTPNTNYMATKVWYRAFYDSDKAFISGSNTQVTGFSFTTPSNAYYFRFSETGTSYNTIIVNPGTVLRTYTPYGYYGNTEKIFDSANNALLSTTLSNIAGTLFSTKYYALPSKIYGIVGKEINIYFDSLVNDDSSQYDFAVECTKGVQQRERWTFVPSVAGTTPIVIRIYYKAGGLLKQLTSSIVAKDVGVGAGVTKTVMVIGDSVTAVGVSTQELLTLFDSDPMNITLQGSNGVAPNLHDGRSGWSSSMFVANTAGNLFWNPAASAFDFSYYMTQKGYAGVDHIIIHLGINDVFGYTSDAAALTGAATVVANLTTMINSIRAYNTAPKIGIALTIPPAMSQDAFGKDYGATQTRIRYKRNNIILVSALITAFGSRSAENIYVVPINLNLDTVNNMNAETVAVNSRNETTVVRQSNGVHPAASGYYQISDSYYYYIKSFES